MKYNYVLQHINIKGKTKRKTKPDILAATVFSLVVPALNIYSYFLNCKHMECMSINIYQTLINIAFCMTPYYIRWIFNKNKH